MFSLSESALVLVDSSISLVDSRVEEVSFVDSKFNPSGRARLVDSSPGSTLVLR